MLLDILNSPGERGVLSRSSGFCVLQIDSVLKAVSMTIVRTSKFAGLVFALALALPLSGCGQKEVKIEDKSSNEALKVSGKEQLKARLAEIASSGSGGSAVSGLRDGLAELKKTDGALADQLAKDLDRLETLQEASEIKALAGQMVDKIK